MRAIMGFAVLLAGVGAAAAHLAEPRRFHTDMTPLDAKADRLGAFSAVAERRSPSSAQAPAESTPFETTVTSNTSAAQLTPAVTVDSGASSNLDSATREALARDIQMELARLGCFAGAVDGVWSPASQQAAGSFVTKANARIPVSEPDFALFSLTKTATPDQACGPAITPVALAPVIEAPPTMGLGGPGERKPAKSAAYHNDRDVQSLFTNPLGR